MERGVQVGERGTVEDIWQKVVKWAMETHGKRWGCPLLNFMHRESSLMDG
jgi:hypothetical protein